MLDDLALIKELEEILGINIEIRHSDLPEEFLQQDSKIDLMYDPEKLTSNLMILKEYHKIYPDSPSYTFNLAMKRNDHIVCLYLLKSSFCEITNTIYKLKHLKVLCLTGSNFRKIPPEICNLVNLELLLIIGNNFLTKIPD